MATAAIVGLNSGKRLLSSSSYYSDLTEKQLYYATSEQQQSVSTKNVNIARKTSNYAASLQSSGHSHSHRHRESSIKAVKERFDNGSITTPLCTTAAAASGSSWRQQQQQGTVSNNPTSLHHDHEESDESNLDPCAETNTCVEALLLLQKSMLEKQLKLSFEQAAAADKLRETTKDQKASSSSSSFRVHVTSSGMPARLRRMNTKRRRGQTKNNFSINQTDHTEEKLPVPTVSPELLHNRLIGYVRGVTSDELLTHAQVVNLSQKIKAGLSLEEHRSRLKERLGNEPSDDQLATFLRITPAELRSKCIECNLAREKLAMSNVRLVMSIAQRYENMGADMADLIQGGLIGLLRGIEKFDPSKGFKISTYVYWWIRQGVSRALVENSRTLRLPTHLHERLSLIRSAKNRLEEKGLTPSIDRIAECLNMSQKKIKNATEAVRSVFSLDREAFPSLNGLPGETFHSYIADNHLENNPWHGVDEWALKREVNNLIDSALRERERDIIRLYYGLDDESLTWEEISKRIGLSRERVRQVGLVALEKLKHAARKRSMEAMLIKH